MTVVPASKVDAYLQQHPETRAVIGRILRGRASDISGDMLVDEHLNPMIEWVFARIEAEVSPQTLTPIQALLFIQELSVFARYNAQFLRRAAESVEGACYELAQELRRNHLEEGGERGKLPAHYVLYSSALLTDLDILVNGRVPLPETETLLVLHDILVYSHCPSTICGGYYATEGVAISETLLLRAITSRYGQLVFGKGGADLPALHYYYSLHLDAEHEAATEGTAVELGHMEGIARFIRQSDAFHLELPRICDGFLQILEGMAHWWTALTLRCKELD